MTTTVLLTGFGRFPGAPFNPTGPLVEALARRRPRSGSVRRIAHVFPTTYDAVDRELPALLAHEKPDVLLMFGLALRARSLRVETCARNALTQIVPDAGGRRPQAAMIAPNAPATLPLSTAAHRLMTAARATGVAASLSRDAGSYLCNYLCWRASEAAAMRVGAPRIAAFVHVPRVHAGPRSRLRQPPFAFEDLVHAGEAMVLAAVAAARAQR
jgi:pyroglutamyl-peptidase